LTSPSPPTNIWPISPFPMLPKTSVNIQTCLRAGELLFKLGRLVSSLFLWAFLFFQNLTSPPPLAHIWPSSPLPKTPANAQNHQCAGESL
jgi:hypothetical protein